MSAVAVLTGLQIAGSVLNYMGEREADLAQADVEELNADFFDIQGELAQFETERELDIFSREGERALGTASSSLAQSGVSFAGSAVAGIAQGALQINKEKAAIARAGKVKVELANLRAEAARNKADALRDRGPSQAIAGLLNIGAIVARDKE